MINIHENSSNSMQVIVQQKHHDAKEHQLDVKEQQRPGSVSSHNASPGSKTNKNQGGSLCISRFSKTKKVGDVTATAVPSAEHQPTNKPAPTESFVANKDVIKSNKKPRNKWNIGMDFCPLKEITQRMLINNPLGAFTILPSTVALAAYPTRN